MSKIAILGDTHFGVRNDSKLFLAFFEKYVQNILIPDLRTNNVSNLFQLGDLFDRRKFINFNTLSEAKRFFFESLRDNGITLHTLVGNHDIYWRESLAVNSSSLVLGEYDNVIVYQEPTTVEIEGTKIDIIPWICKENQEEVLQFVKKSKSDLCFGHFEFSGFYMYRGMEAHGGDDVTPYAKYELICSGHYHTKSTRDNIVYVGTPYEMTWQDYNDPRGHHLFDLEERTLTFIQNPYTIFYRLEYDDTKELVDLASLDLKDCYVKLVVVNKTDLYKFDSYVNSLYAKNCADIKIHEDLSDYSDGEIDETIDLEDTVNILSNYIDSLDSDIDKEKVKNFLKSLYIEALNSEQ